MALAMLLISLADETSRLPSLYFTFFIYKKGIMILTFFVKCFEMCRGEGQGIHLFSASPEILQHKGNAVKGPQTGARFAKGERGLWKTETAGTEIIRVLQRRGR